MTTPEDLIRQATKRLYGNDEALAQSAIERLNERRARAGKTCTRCGARKPLAEFGSNMQQADGLEPRCKECRAETAREARSR